MQHGITFAGQQGIDTGASGPRHLPETASFEFMGQEHLALVARQFFQRVLQRAHQHAARVGRLRVGTGGRQGLRQPVPGVLVRVIAIARELVYNPYWALDAAQKLNADPDFTCIPPNYGYWLGKRAKSAFEGVPSTYGAAV